MNELREFYYTERNSDLFIQLCQSLKKNIKDDATLDTLDFAEEASRIDGTDTSENVIVITDTYCEWS